MMIIDNLCNLRARDGQIVYYYVWDKVEQPKGVVQIFHGMAEHAKRYESFAKFLNSRGFIVYADDHRGHGKTAGKVEKIGCVGKDGFSNIVDDEYEITQLIKQKYNNIPLVILGHSFGSFVAQEYIIRYSNDIDGAIISGTAYRKGGAVVFGKILSTIGVKLFGEENPSKIIDRLSFLGYNKKINNPKSVHAWLSRDEEKVKEYDDDECCGTTFTSGFWYHFFNGMSMLNKENRIAMIRKSLPIFVFAGTGDPVGSYGKLVKLLYDKYKEAGIKDVSLRLYPDGRHEMLNETNREEVYSDIYKWVNKFVLKK